MGEKKESWVTSRFLMWVTGKNHSLKTEIEADEQFQEERYMLEMSAGHQIEVSSMQQYFQV